MSYITDENYKDFKTAYITARDEGREVFDFEGQDILTSYAKYVCEYVDKSPHIQPGQRGRRSEVGQ